MENREVLNLIDENITDDERKFIVKLDKFKDDLMVLLDEGVIRDVILKAIEECPNVDFFSDRNRRQLNPKAPIMVLKIVNPKEMMEKHKSSLLQYGIRYFEDVEAAAIGKGGDDKVLHERVTSFTSAIINAELTRNITRDLYTIATERFKYTIKEEQTKEEEIDFMLLFSSIFGYTVQKDTQSINAKKVFVRMIL